MAPGRHHEDPVARPSIDSRSSIPSYAARAPLCPSPRRSGSSRSSRSTVAHFFGVIWQERFGLRRCSDRACATSLALEAARDRYELVLSTHQELCLASLVSVDPRMRLHFAHRLDNDYTDTNVDFDDAIRWTSTIGTDWCLSNAATPPTPPPRASSSTTTTNSGSPAPSRPRGRASRRSPGPAPDAQRNIIKVHFAGQLYRGCAGNCMLCELFDDQLGSTWRGRGTDRDLMPLTTLMSVACRRCRHSRTVSRRLGVLVPQHQWLLD